MQFLPGTTVIPREIEDNGYAKFLDVNKLRYGLCENAELGTLIENEDDCNENMNDKGIRDYLKLLLAALAIIVHVLNKTSLCRKFHVVVAPKDDLEMYQKVRFTCSVVWVFLFAVL